MASTVRITTETGNGIGLGTGFVYGRAANGDVQIITAYHVVSDALAIQVTYNDLTAVSATLLGYDPVRDIAAISTRPHGVNSIPIRSASDLEIGETLYKIGFGTGVGSAAAASGIVSRFEEGRRYRPTQIQTDIAVNQGDSGGPVFTRDGRVVGVVSTKLVATEIEGVNHTGTFGDNAWLQKLLGKGIVCAEHNPLAELGTKVFFDPDLSYYVNYPSTFSATLTDTSAGFLAPFSPGAPVPALRYTLRGGVYVYLPELKSQVGGAEGLLYIELNRRDVGATQGVQLLSRVMEVCVPGALKAFEVDFKYWHATSPGVSVDNYIEHRRLLTFEMGSSVYAIEMFAWPELFSGFKADFDALAYSFRFTAGLPARTP